MTIAEVLSGAGYRTLMAGKWHVGHREGQRPADRGFDRFYGIPKHVDSYWRVLRGCEVFLDDKMVLPATAPPVNHLAPDRPWYTTDVFTDYALEFIDKSVRGPRPFFLYLAYNAPHWPLEAPDVDIAKYKGKYAGGWEKLRTAKHKRMVELGIIRKTWKLSPLDGVEWDSLSVEKKQEMEFRREIYAAQIDRMDQNIGRLVEHLKKHRILDDTLIMFLSDNGCSAEGGMFGYRHTRNKKANFDRWRSKSGTASSQGRPWANASNVPFRLFKKWDHEGGIATPFIAHWPNGIRSKQEIVHQPGHVIDVMATCCDAAGAKYPDKYRGLKIKPLQGKSLLPIFAGRQRTPHASLYWEHEKHAAIRTGKWKLVSLNAAEDQPWELYDLEADRTELTDLAGKYPQRAAKMKADWTAWARQTNVLPWPRERKRKQN